MYLIDFKLMVTMMRKFLLVVFTFLGFCSFSVVASERNFVPIAGEGQDIEYEKGNKLLVSVTDKAFLAVSYSPNDGKSGFIKIEIKNVTGSSFTVSESDISASSGQGDLTVMTYAERIKQQKRENMWNEIMVGLSGAVDSYYAGSAGYEESSGTFNLSGNGSTVRGSYSGTTYNSAAAYQAKTSAELKNMQLQERQEENAKFLMKDLEGRAFRANTLSPGEWMVGDVKLLLPKKNKKNPADFVMTISVAGEPMRFRFREQSK
jgi:hypothetical protein